jgi:serpin B
MELRAFFNRRGDGARAERPGRLVDWLDHGYERAPAVGSREAVHRRRHLSLGSSTTRPEREGWVKCTAMRPLLAAVLMFGLLGCVMMGDDSLPLEPPPFDLERSRKEPETLSAELADRVALAQGNAAFAFDLYSRARPAGENFVYAPFSLSTALAMTYAGARGTTEQEMSRALRFAPQDQLHPPMRELDAILRERGRGPSVDLKVTNTVWAQKGFAIEPPFLDTLAWYYDAGVALVDFEGAPEATRQIINSEISRRTRHKIDDLLPAGVIDPMTRLVLANAITFKAQWLVPFPAEQTRSSPFKRLDGSTTDVTTMTAADQIFVALGDGWSAADLAYGDERLVMTIVVPDEGRFAEIEGSFDARAFEQIVSQMKLRKTRVVLPRWTAETPLRLDAVLAEMGMPSAFNGDADFSGIDGTRRLYLQAVVQKASIAVGEYGTEAAAASAVVVGEKSAGPPADVTIVADRPFMFVVRDKPTGVLLFLGRVLDPGRGPS